MAKKINCLRSILRSYERVLVAFSGGVDSTLVLTVAVEVLGPARVRAVTAAGVWYPQRELKDARMRARAVGVRHHIVRLPMMKVKRFQRNDRQRCFMCKQGLFRACRQLATRWDIEVVCDGSTVDDGNAYRPGAAAAAALHVRHPLIEAGFTKRDVRRCSRALGLSTWNAPALSCLATRFPYNVILTPQKLRAVDRAEECLRARGLGMVRVRWIEQGVRIEVAECDIAKFSRKSFRDKCIGDIKKLGFHYITLDMQGYRSGSMDEI